MCVYLCEYMLYMCRRAQKPEEGSEPLEKALGVVVNDLTWVFWKNRKQGALSCTSSHYFTNPNQIADAGSGKSAC